MKNLRAMRAVLIGGGGVYSSANAAPRRDILLDAGLDLTGQEKPNVLIIPSARWKSDAGWNKAVGHVSDYYKNRGLATSVLHPYLPQNHEGGNLEIDYARMPGRNQLEDHISTAGLAFVLGGGTDRLLKIWRDHGIDTMLTENLPNMVVSGTSAGTIAWFQGGHTNSDSVSEQKRITGEATYDGFSYLPALGVIMRTTVCPHYDAAPEGRLRESSFDAMMTDRLKTTNDILGLGIDDDAAILIQNGHLSALRGEGNGRGDVYALTLDNDFVLSKTVIAPFDSPVSLEWATKLSPDAR